MKRQVTGIITLFYVWKCFWQGSPRNGFCVPTQNQIFLCFELEQIWDHIYYTNAPLFYSESGLRFALAQSIKNLILCGACLGTQKPFLGDPCQKLFPTKTRVIISVGWHVIPQKNSRTLLVRWLKGCSNWATLGRDIPNQSRHTNFRTPCT